MTMREKVEIPLQRSIVLRRTQEVWDLMIIATALAVRTVRLFDGTKNCKEHLTIWSCSQACTGRIKSLRASDNDPLRFYTLIVTSSFLCRFALLFPQRSPIVLHPPSHSWRHLRGRPSGRPRRWFARVHASVRRRWCVKTLLES
jgi:hypothetical protein